MNMTDLNVTTAPKTATFQMRINPEIKAEAERIFARSGLTMTDAVNMFLQQTINEEGFPMGMTRAGREMLRQQAIAALFDEIEKGRSSVQTEDDWIDGDEILREFGGS
ncbi:MAG: type II toxin-antitoxin system RelB/DinJ family antitoxin [Clostridia bacterium]|nr:type II toxin-antitoxin system RelB/DinJ family antitoxin [Clostridia bacterium]